MPSRNIRRSDAARPEIVRPSERASGQEGDLIGSPAGVALARSFYDRSPEIVARDLLGKLLVYRMQERTLGGRIVETEAYLGLDDPASHASVGRTDRNAVLFGPPGFSYVYFIYGMHFCLNVSCLPTGEAGGVLFRALVPMFDVGMMRDLRSLRSTATAEQISGGPGRLCQSLGITRANGNDLDVTLPESPLQILDDGAPAPTVVVTPRIGIRKAAERPLRFLVDDLLSSRRKIQQRSLAEPT